MKQVIQNPLDRPGTRVVVSERWHRTSLAVQVADTDYGGCVYHGRYFALYNQARDVFLDTLGVSYFSLMKRGMNLSVAETHARYLKPVSYGEDAWVLTKISWLRSRSLGVIQKMVTMAPDKKSDILKNQVEMNLVCINTDSGAVPLPDDFINAVRLYYGANGLKTVSPPEPT